MIVWVAPFQLAGAPNSYPLWLKRVGGHVAEHLLNRQWVCSRDICIKRLCMQAANVVEAFFE